MSGRAQNREEEADWMWPRLPALKKKEQLGWEAWGREEPYCDEENKGIAGRREAWGRENGDSASMDFEMCTGICDSEGTWRPVWASECNHR